ncbi:vasopressin V1a receptor-like, partial [Tropilaelaps mercedesae]
MENQTGHSLHVSNENPQGGASAVKCVTLLTILVMTLTSNLFVLWAVLLRRRSRNNGFSRIKSLTRVQLFMVHLSVADILVALLNITPQLAWVITVDFRGGVLLCKGITYAQVLVLYLSTYILTGMSLDRLISMRAIYAQWRSGMPLTNGANFPSTSICSRPLAIGAEASHRLSHFNNHHSRVEYRKFAKVLIVVAWLLAFVLALPQLYIFSYIAIPPADINASSLTDADKPYNAQDIAQPANERVRHNCLADFSFHPHGKQIYVTSFVVIVLGVPVFVMLFSYSYMCVIILRIQRGYDSEQSQMLPANQTPSVNGGFAVSNQRLTAAKMRLVKMTFAVVLCFIVCWSPFCVAELVSAYTLVKKAETHHVSALLIICMLLASLNSAMNPWIYAAFYARGNRRKRQDKSISSDIT